MNLLAPPPLELPTLRDELLLTTETPEEFEAKVLAIQTGIDEDLRSLPTEDEKRAYWGELEYLMCQASCYYYLTHYAYTLNPKAQIKFGEQQAALFPKSRKLWLQCKLFQENELIIWFMSKSRREMESWNAVGMFTWLAMFRPLENISFRSKDLFTAGLGAKNIDAYDCLLGRSEIIYGSSPNFIKRRIPSSKSRQQNRHQLTFGHFDFVLGKRVDSVITAYPTTPKSARGATPTGELVDEFAELREISEIYDADVPAMLDGGKGRMMFVGTVPKEETASKAWAREMIFGSDDETIEEPPFVELMPYGDSLRGVALRAVMNDETDHIVFDRFLGKRRRRYTIATVLYFTAGWERGKQYEEELINTLPHASQRREYWNDWNVTGDEDVVSWRLDPKLHIQRCTYDPHQTSPFDRGYRMYDPGGRYAGLFLQKVKVLRGPQYPHGEYTIPGNGYQVRIFGEVDGRGTIDNLSDDMINKTESLCRDAVKDPHGIPWINHPDVAVRQRDMVSGQRYVQHIVDRSREKEPHFKMVQHYIARVEGIAVFGRKIHEVLGYELPSPQWPDGKPIPGLIVDPRCWRSVSILRGAGLFDPDDGGVSKSKTNKKNEHIMDLFRYFSAHEIKPGDILTASDLKTTPEPPKLKMTPAELKAAADRYYIEQAEKAAEETQKEDDWLDEFEVVT